MPIRSSIIVLHASSLSNQKENSNDKNEDTLPSPSFHIERSPLYDHDLKNTITKISLKTTNCFHILAKADYLQFGSARTNESIDPGFETLKIPKKINKRTPKSIFSELFASVGVAELPVWRSNVVSSDSLTVTGRNFKGQRLPFEIRIDVPVLAPISAH